MNSNLAAFVRARLLNIAKADKSDFNQVLLRYALERFLYRLSKSAHADHFLLKGGNAVQPLVRHAASVNA